MSEKKVPKRKCVGCGQMKDRCTLLRFAKDGSGKVVYDKSGRMQSRGAYICNDSKCFLAAKKASRLERAFSTKNCEEAYEAVKKEYFNK